MARIVENPNGRRMIRLSADDVMSIVNRYTLEMRELSGRSDAVTYDSFKSALGRNPYYLPEEQ